MFIIHCSLQKVFSYLPLLFNEWSSQIVQCLRVDENKENLVNITTIESPIIHDIKLYYIVQAINQHFCEYEITSCNYRRLSAEISLIRSN